MRKNIFVTNNLLKILLVQQAERNCIATRYTIKQTLNILPLLLLTALPSVVLSSAVSK